MAHVIILGCGRSGTSILGELFDHLKTYDYLFEPSVGKIRRHALPPGQQLAVKVPKSRWLWRSPGLACNLRSLRSAVGTEHRIVWIVRHPLDTICSLKPGVADGWRHRPQPPLHWLYRRRPLIEKCAMHWAHINDRGYRQVVKAGYEPVVVRYEKLVRQPRQMVQVLMNRLEIDEPWDHVEEYCRLVQDRTRDSYHAKRQTRWYRENHAVRIGRWRQELTEEELALAYKYVKQPAERFGYLLPAV